MFFTKLDFFVHFQQEHEEGHALVYHLKIKKIKASSLFNVYDRYQWTLSVKSNLFLFGGTLDENDGF
jgi:hypothetical protein